MSKESKSQKISTVDAAAEIGVTTQTIREWIKDGYRGRRLKAIQYGRQWRIDEGEWLAFKRYFEDQAQGRSSSPVDEPERVG